MANDSKQPTDEQIKRAFVRGFVNTLSHAGTEKEKAVSMAKKAVAHREDLYSEATQGRLQKRASEIGGVLLEKSKKEAVEA